MEHILVIDDHPIFIDGITALLKSIVPDSNIVTCANGKSALQQLQKTTQFDWIFLDIKLPDLTGIDLLKEFLNLKILTHVVIVSSDENPETIHQCLELHANGFISKKFNKNIFEQCIQTIKKGNIYLEKEQAHLVKNYQEGIYVEKSHILKHISERQSEALQMIAKGYSNQEIATLMNITQSTVKTHISLLINLFEVDSRSHCVAKARRLGLIN